MSSISESKLLALPTELRLQIFEHLLVSGSSLSVCGCYSPSFSDSCIPSAIFGGDESTSSANQPFILLVSRAIRKEALPLFYQNNRFLLEVHYSRASTKASRWLDSALSNSAISRNLWQVSVKHRFGILESRGTIDFDLKEFRVVGPHPWSSSIPPIYVREVHKILGAAREAGQSDDLRVRTVQQLIEVLGVLAD
jgi:hypothetical protein